MADRVEVESLREVGIYLAQILTELAEMKADREEEQRQLRESRTQRNFVLVSAFVAPIVLTFVYNAAGLGHI